MQAEPIHITDDQFQREVLESSAPVLVDFWAPWCAPCRMIAPTLEALARKFTGRVTIAKIDTEQHGRAARRYGVRGIPTLVLFRDGREIGRSVGALPEEQLERWLEEALAEVPV